MEGGRGEKVCRMSDTPSCSRRMRSVNLNMVDSVTEDYQLCVSESAS